MRRGRGINSAKRMGKMSGKCLERSDWIRPGLGWHAGWHGSSVTCTDERSGVGRCVLTRVPMAGGSECDGGRGVAVRGAGRPAEKLPGPGTEGVHSRSNKEKKGAHSSLVY